MKELKNLKSQLHSTEKYKQILSMRRPVRARTFAETLDQVFQITELRENINLEPTINENSEDIPLVTPKEEAFKLKTT